VPLRLVIRKILLFRKILLLERVESGPLLSAPKLDQVKFGTFGDWRSEIALPWEKGSARASS